MSGTFHALFPVQSVKLANKSMLNSLNLLDENKKALDSLQENLTTKKRTLKDLNKMLTVHTVSFAAGPL